ncbi:hypothetical protein GCM10027043_04300 [Ferruginibacter profundus]
MLPTSAEKLFLFGTATLLDFGLGGAGKLAPSQQQKIDVIGATLNFGTGQIKDQLSSKPEDKARPRKKEKIAKSLEILKKL